MITCNSCLRLDDSSLPRPLSTSCTNFPVPDPLVELWMCAMNLSFYVEHFCCHLYRRLWSFLALGNFWLWRPQILWGQLICSPWMVENLWEQELIPFFARHWSLCCVLTFNTLHHSHALNFFSLKNEFEIQTARWKETKCTVFWRRCSGVWYRLLMRQRNVQYVTWDSHTLIQYFLCSLPERTFSPAAVRAAPSSRQGCFPQEQ